MVLKVNISSKMCFLIESTNYNRVITEWKVPIFSELLSDFEIDSLRHLTKWATLNTRNLLRATLEMNSSVVVTYVLLSVAH